MKFIYKPEYVQYKTVHYFDLTLAVPATANFISVDEEGRLYLWLYEPVLRKFADGDDAWYDWSGEVVDFYAGTVDLEGMDWKDTLQAC